MASLALASLATQLRLNYNSAWLLKVAELLVLSYSMSMGDFLLWIKC